MKSILPSAIASSPLAERVVRKLAGDYLEKKYYKEFFAGLNDVNPDLEQKGKILLYSGISSMYLTPIEILFYHQLRQAGFEVDYLVYDKSVTYNEVTTKARRDAEGDGFWQRSSAKGLANLTAAGVAYQTISISEKAAAIIEKLPDNLEALFSFQYDGYEVGDIVKGVMYRYYKSIAMGEDACTVAKQFLITTLTNYFEIKSRCENNNYHTIMFSHGIYCTWQILVDYCKNNGLDYICYDRGKIKGCINVNRNNPSPVWDMTEAWERLKNYQLSDQENAQVDQYLKERETQKGDVYAYNFSEKSDDISALKTQLGIGENKKVITIFTNLIWDAANVSRDIAFESPLDCIKQTIEHYRNSNQVHILIRSHPAEKVLGTSERYGELVRSAFNNELPGNVTIVEPEMNINSFSILDISTIGVVHTSTVGIEMAIEGKPVILISETHYRNCGFTYDAKNSEDYFETLDDLIKSNSIKSKQIELARKYFYLMMFEYQHEMPLKYTIGNLFNGFEAVLSISNTGLNQCNKIIQAISDHNRDFIFR